MSADLTGKIGLVLTWEVDNQTRFWSFYQQGIASFLTTMHKNGELSLALPYEHKPLRRSDTPSSAWTNCLILLFKDEGTIHKYSTDIVSCARSGDLAPYFRAADLMRVQQSINMVYAARNGLTRERRLIQGIEYVFSKPECREEYYRDQYVWSGPVMRELHSKDYLSRFLGFEIHKRLDGSPLMPKWDVLHIFGATSWQWFKAIPTFRPTWNRHAKNIWGEGMTFKQRLAEWDDMRTIVKGPAKQKHNLTLQVSSQNLNLFL
ncbi:MAG: hypothetical protein AAF708_13560 [Deinococcota bacterium]